MQFRFQAQDLPGAGSVVEAALDEIEIIEPAIAEKEFFLRKAIGWSLRRGNGASVAASAA